MRRRRVADGSAGGGVMDFDLPLLGVEANPWLVGAVFTAAGWLLSLIPQELLPEWLKIPVPLWHVLIALSLLALAFWLAFRRGNLVWRGKKARAQGVAEENPTSKAQEGSEGKSAAVQDHGDSASKIFEFMDKYSHLDVEISYEEGEDREGRKTRKATVKPTSEK